MNDLSGRRLEMASGANSFMASEALSGILKALRFWCAEREVPEIKPLAPTGTSSSKAHGRKDDSSSMEQLGLAPAKKVSEDASLTPQAQHPLPLQFAGNPTASTIVSPALIFLVLWPTPVVSSMRRTLPAGNFRVSPLDAVI
jgi:hypothetical protein